jgi:hypothetical protein
LERRTAKNETKQNKTKQKHAVTMYSTVQDDALIDTTSVITVLEDQHKKRNGERRQG